ncbi:MAG: hypothetical protein PHE77_00600 [Candidatus Pacebacteria bacterium]|nr:hypothetical protein [Candidatus Paceibacterota bacterium]
MNAKVKFEFVPMGFTSAKIAETLNLKEDDFIAVDVGGEQFDHHSEGAIKCAAELMGDYLVASTNPRHAYQRAYGAPKMCQIVVSHFSPDVDSVIATYLASFETLSQLLGWEPCYGVGLHVDLAEDEFANDWEDFGKAKAISILDQLTSYAHAADFAEFEKLGKSGFAAVVAGLNLIHGRDNGAILRDAHKILSAALEKKTSGVIHVDFMRAMVDAVMRNDEDQQVSLFDLSDLPEAQEALARIKSEKEAVVKAKASGKLISLPNGDIALLVETATQGITMAENGYGTEFQILVLHNPEKDTFRVLCAPIVGDRYRGDLKILATALDGFEESQDSEKPSDREHNWFAHPGGQMLCSPSISGKTTWEDFQELVLKALGVN